MPIRVLMVTDAEGSYKKEGERFGLTELVAALEQGNMCKVTKAHRYPSGWAHTGNADIHSFQFDNATHFDPKKYDEVWLMGFASNNPLGPYGDPVGYELSTAEIEKLALFMEDGGGVFATGDHDDLGKDLCGNLPRVRSMRHWEADYSWWTAYKQNPNVDLATVVPDFNKSPPPVGPYRLDTLETGHNTHYEFQDQSDDVPQYIAPVLRTISKNIRHLAGGYFGTIQKIPHALLCGTKGVINILPDHMHEGRCYVPDKLEERTFPLYKALKREYPDGKAGVVISPEVVAYGRTNPRAKDANYNDPDGGFNDSNTPVFLDNFAQIVAYDGHKADVGRVVVDSTFHHFVNINVIGVESAYLSTIDPVDAVKAKGFLASEKGIQEYARIKEYWRNIARWICKPTTLDDFVWREFQETAFDPRLKQTIPLGNFDKLPTAEVLRYGSAAFNILRERFGTCTIISFVTEIAIPNPLSYLLREVFIKKTLPDPPPYERIREELAIDKMEVALFALGAAMLELRQPEFIRLHFEGKLEAGRGLEAVRKAADIAARRSLTEQAEQMQNAVSAIKQALEVQELKGGRGNKPRSTH